MAEEEFFNISLQKLFNQNDSNHHSSLSEHFSGASDLEVFVRVLIFLATSHAPMYG